MAFYFNMTLPVGFEEAGRRTTEALKQEAFGIITKIDVKDTFQKKFGIEFRNYRILGACNHGLARRRLNSRTRLEPCCPAMSDLAPSIAAGLEATIWSEEGGFGWRGSVIPLKKSLANCGRLRFGWPKASRPPTSFGGSECSASPTTAGGKCTAGWAWTRPAA
jgi:hypothetical protein